MIGGVGFLINYRCGCLFTSNLTFCMKYLSMLGGTLSKICENKKVAFPLNLTSKDLGTCYHTDSKDEMIVWPVFALYEMADTDNTLRFVFWKPINLPTWFWCKLYVIFIGDFKKVRTLIINKGFLNEFFVYINIESIKLENHTFKLSAKIQAKGAGIKGVHTYIDYSFTPRCPKS